MNLNEHINTPFSTVGFLTLKRTYARRLNENDPNSPTEDFPDIANRVVLAANSQLGVGFTSDEQQRLRRYHLELKGTVAGRFLWQLGTKTVDTLGLASLQNCAFTVVDEPVRPFTWAMDMLMLGSGVGYNIQREHVNKLPEVRANFIAPSRQDNASADYIISDTREGWVALLSKTLKAAFLSEKDKPTFSYSTQLIRGKGAPIKGFGGTASGPEDLCWGIAKISEVLEKRAGKKIRPIDALDIMNIIGAVVVAGNVRRSAQIAIGDCDDVEYLLSKRWDMGNIPSWRAMSNNSVVCDNIRDLHEYFWDGYTGKGEPFGLINLALSRKMGRLGETQYPDPKVMGYNPCLHPDTLVSTVNGQVRIADMTTPTKVYSMDANGKLCIKQATASWVSKRDARTMKVRINTGAVVTCTPDHKIFTAKRGWVEAQDLRIGDRVVHLSRTRRGTAYAGVRLTSQPVKEQVMEHRLVWESVHGPIPAGHDVHHVDEDTFNNVVTNLECLTHSAHSTLTRHSCANDHQVWGENGDFVSNNSGYVKPVKNIPDHLKTGLKNWAMVVAVEEGPATDVYDITVEDTHNFVAENIIVHNCAEQGLAPYETCCLAEIFLSNITSREEFLDVAKLLYRVAKHSLALPCHHAETERIVHENMRMGLGVTGVLQATKEQRGWCDWVYERLREYDVVYSAEKGFPVSIKLTTCKPSGTLSLLPGVTPGIHPAYAQYMIRRIRIMADHSLVQICRDHGYPVEYQRNFDNTEDRSTVVVSFPFSYPDGTVMAKDMTAVDQLKAVKELQKTWSDNAVSCTVYYKLEELPEIRKYLSRNYKDNHKSLSFLLHSDHGFKQAPYEEVTKEVYDALFASTRLITSLSTAEFEGGDECASGACPIR